jgi:hypothetical protein
MPTNGTGKVHKVHPSTVYDLELPYRTDDLVWIPSRENVKYYPIGDSGPGDAGLRCGEIRALRWSSIDFRNRLLTVERAFSLDEIVTPKSDKIRTVPLTERLREALQKHREIHVHTNVLVTQGGRPPSIATGSAKRSARPRCWPGTVAEPPRYGSLVKSRT